MGRGDPLAARDEPPPATYESGGFAARRLQRWALERSDVTRDQRASIGPLAAHAGDGRLRAFRDDACAAWPQLPPNGKPGGRV
jgi:hypothetical protein